MMDLFGPIFGILLVALLLVDHSILGNRISQLEKEMKRYERNHY